MHGAAFCGQAGWMLHGRVSGCILPPLYARAMPESRFNHFTGYTID